MISRGYLLLPFLLLVSFGSLEKASANEIGLSKAASESAIGTAIIGSWRLVSWVVKATDGTVTHPMGENPVGLLMYDKLGYMSVHLMNSFRPIFEMGYAETTLEELKDVYDGYIAYFGTFTIDVSEQTITHHVDGITNPSFVTTKLVRYYDFLVDKLVLSTDKQKTSSLTWLRIRDRTPPAARSE
jgi:hypothetical protein